ncbi:peptidoglycan recognition family protein [Corynebacterium bovis]|uniref:peptidoglycan recognition protein family protein n=1 Tax=Corynebacterium bovis TaxID=36808 RepID=UPI00254C99BC|nr:peptidoglycan recognition family protein [Corynebacterium bovis]MDK8511675.1 peptidoglycan recognition family protein [Corynebacterium bovis]
MNTPITSSQSTSPQASPSPALSRRRFGLGALAAGATLAVLPAARAVAAPAAGTAPSPATGATEATGATAGLTRITVPEAPSFLSLRFPGDSTALAGSLAGSLTGSLTGSAAGPLGSSTGTPTPPAGTPGTPTVPTATVHFTAPDGTRTSRTVHPSGHCRDGAFPLCSDPVAVPAGATEAYVDTPTTTAHIHRVETGDRTVADPEATVLPGLTVVSRRQWGADEALMTWAPEWAPPVCVTVHHTAVPTGREPQYRHNWPAAVRSVYRFHASSDDGGRGWGDIGYHLVIDPEGVVYQGRSTGVAGHAVFRPGSAAGQVVTAGHVYRANTGNIGVCLIGDFQTGEPTAAALDSLTTVLTALCSALGLDPEGRVRYVNAASSIDLTQPTVTGHRDWEKAAGTTECPGDNLWRRLPELRRRVAAAVGGTTPSGLLSGGSR